MKFTLPPTLALLPLASLTAAAPTDLVERATCTFTTASAAISGKTSCTTIILDNIAVPAGTTLDLTGLTTGTKVIFQGRTTFGYKEWVGPLVSVSGTSITVGGASGTVLDGQGDRWWDGQGGNGGKTEPKFFAAHKLTDSVIDGIKILKSPVQVFSVNGASGLAMSNIVVDDSLGDSKGGRNTDAFDVGSSDDVTVSNSVITNSDNGVRTKTVSGATGKVNNVEYTGITLSKIHKYGVVIEQDYQNGSPTGTPTAGVPITGLTLTNVKGTVDSSATNIYVLCAKGACSGWSWSGISVTGGKKSTKCSNVPATAFC